MPTDEQFRRIRLYVFVNVTVVFWGVSPDMGYPNINLLTLESLVQGEFLLDHMVVYVSVNTP